MKILIVNPLAGTLAHYSAELTAVLTNHEAPANEVHLAQLREPSFSGTRPSRWVLEYVKQLAALRRRGTKFDLVISTWPVLGYLDIALLRLFARGQFALIVHDPTPLVRGIGMNRWSRRLGSFLAKRSSIIVHSATAAFEIRDIGRERATVLPHPVLRPPAAAQSASSERVVRVLGQWKPDRDLELIAEVARRLRRHDVAVEVIGRGWPSIPDCAVRNRFVSESELTDLIRDSAVVFVPYKRFYQSGIAIRCIEQGTPCVGPDGAFFRELYGPSSPMLAKLSDAEAWVEALEHALTTGRAETVEVGARLFSQASDQWRSWIATITPRS